MYFYAIERLAINTSDMKKMLAPGFPGFRSRKFTGDGQLVKFFQAGLTNYKLTMIISLYSFLKELYTLNE